MPDRTPACITLLTDYGLAAPFVGVLHAVAFQIAPGARVIDLDHSVPAHNVRVGAQRLALLVPYLPAGVHVAVVDPGVGTERRAIAARAGDQFFVAPDNGLVSWALEAAGGADEAAILENPRYRLASTARTFDGRDIFVPAAAHLARGVPLRALGPALDPNVLVSLARPRVERRADGSLLAEVVQVDGFGNVQLAAAAGDLGALGLALGEVVVLETPAGVTARARCTETFGAGAPGELVLLLDSDGRLALAANQARAQELLALTPGDLLLLRGGDG